jgi:hypothetical protein
VVVGGLVPTLILAALATGAAPFKERRWADTPPAVVIRTIDNVFVGTDLRYETGVFHLRDGKEDVAVDEAKVARISFLRVGGEEFGLTMVTAAARSLAYRRFESGPARAEGVFILPGEPVPETFRWAARKIHQPEALAVLCLELASPYVKEHRPEVALAELDRAEKESTSDPQRGFVFGLMRAAVLRAEGRKKEEDDAVERLRKTYPDHHTEIDHFLRPLGERLGPFRPK